MSAKRTAAGKRAGTKTAAPRKRLSPEAREKMIVEEAIRYFAEHGFEGDTRALAKRIGVSQGLIFRYFPTKADLIERVYRDVFLKRWNPEWEDMITDRSRPLKARLVAFYEDYHRTVDSYEWIRVALFSALRGEPIMGRYLVLVRNRLVIPIARELRAHYRLPDPDDVPLRALELELVWDLHSFVIYNMIRRHVYGEDNAASYDGGTTDAQEAAIGAYVRTFLAGARGTLKSIVLNGKNAPINTN
ncbi:MAG: TetR/AcrR family transcriptional regulator [Alphaproteobacteria bacterium]|nr:TetR/AcrR family transcriptional regulator [Alphaproteobacteria bacterium]